MKGNNGSKRTQDKRHRDELGVPVAVHRQLLEQPPLVLVQHEPVKGNMLSSLPQHRTNPATPPERSKGKRLVYCTCRQCWRSSRAQWRWWALCRGAYRRCPSIAGAGERRSPDLRQQPCGSRWLSSLLLAGRLWPDMKGTSVIVDGISTWPASHEPIIVTYLKGQERKTEWFRKSPTFNSAKAAVAYHWAREGLTLAATGSRDVSLQSGETVG